MQMSNEMKGKIFNKEWHSTTIHRKEGGMEIFPLKKYLKIFVDQ